MKWYCILFSLLFTCIIWKVNGQNDRITDTPTRVWKEISGKWSIGDNKFSPFLKEEKKTTKNYILIRNDMNSDSRWDYLQLEFKFETVSENISAGLVLNTNNPDDFGFLRISKSDDKVFLQAGVWKYNKFRTSMNAELEESILPDIWYSLKVIPTENRDEYRCWTIILAEKEKERIIFKSGIINQLPLFGRGITGLYADGNPVSFQNFQVHTSVPDYHTVNLKVAPLFANGMVFQRETPVTVWGKGQPGEMVSIYVNDNVFKTKAEDTGNWKITLPSMKAADSIGFMIISTIDTVLLQDVAVGEVWLASGQSNMHMKVWQSDVAEVTKKISEDKYLRFFIQPEWPSEVPLFDNGGKWEQANSANMEEWSAVACSFAIKLREKLKVPVGVIWSSWGGTTAECWLPREELKKDTLTKPILDQYVRAKNALENGEKLFGIHPYNVPGHHKSPGALFNGMIYPHIPFSIKGVIWYQGESNSIRAKQYESLFPLLINSWRDQWNNSDLYFAFVQLAGYNGGQSGSEIEHAWPQLRDAQRITTKKINNTGMAVAIDLGHQTNIHPRQKNEVGERLARLVLHDVYKFDKIVRSGPLYVSSIFTNHYAIIRFSEIADELKISNRQNLTGFTIAGQSQKFFPANACIDNDGKQVKVWSDAVPEPVAVRYAWENYPGDANLVNSEGLPASPFRTDEWPLPTDKNR